MELKKGDVISHDFLEQYDRETYKGIVIEKQADGLVKIAAIDKYEDGYYFNGLKEIKSESLFKETFGKAEDYGIEV